MTVQAERIIIGPKQEQLVEAHRKNDAHKDAAIAGQWLATIGVVAGVTTGLVEVIKGRRRNALALLTMGLSGAIVYKKLGEFIQGSDAKQQWINAQQQ